jgi:hypothetical protein
VAAVKVERVVMMAARVHPHVTGLTNGSTSRLRAGRHGGMRKIEEAASGISCVPV